MVLYDLIKIAIASQQHLVAYVMLLFALFESSPKQGGSRPWIPLKAFRISEI